MMINGHNWRGKDKLKEEECKRNMQESKRILGEVKRGIKVGHELIAQKPRKYHTDAYKNKQEPKKNQEGFELCHHLHWSAIIVAPTFTNWIEPPVCRHWICGRNTNKHPFVVKVKAEQKRSHSSCQNWQSELHQETNQFKKFTLPTCMDRNPLQAKGYIVRIKTKTMPPPRILGLTAHQKTLSQLH